MTRRRATQTIPRTAKRSRPKRAGARVEKRSILIADDDLPNARLAESWLRERDWAVSRAEDGVEALELLAPSCFDLVLVALELPALNGWELLRYLHGRWELGLRLSRGVTHVIAMSHRTEPEVARFAFRLGAEAFLHRPPDREKLIEAADTLAPVHAPPPQRPAVIEWRA